MELNLQPSDKGILKKIRDAEEISTQDLYEKVDKDTYSTDKGLSNRLKVLEEDKKLLNRNKGDNNANIWSLNDKGVRALEKIVRRQNQEAGSDYKVYDLENAIEGFTDYFEDAASDQLDQLAFGEPVLELDHQDLAKFSPELADKFREQPKKTFEACREAVESFPDVPENVDIRLSNPHEVEIQTIADIAPGEQEGQLITVEGVLETVTEPKSDTVKGIFECRSCMEKYEKIQDSNKFKSPYKCQECGSKKFKTLEKVKKTVKLAKVKDKPGRQHRKSIPIKISGRLATDNQKTLNSTGQAIRVTGYIDTYKKRKNDEYDSVRIVANNLETEENKWSDIEVSQEDVEEMQEWKKGFENFSDLKVAVRDSLAKERLADADLLKESFLVWFLGRSGEGNLHILNIGEPGKGKSEMANYVRDNFPRVLKSVGTSSTGVGLTAAVRKDELTGDWVAEAGAVAQAHGGFHITDEIDKARKEDINKLNEALEEKKISLSKANIHATIPADVSEYAMGNPNGDKLFDPYKPIYKQLPFQEAQDIIDRFDLIMALERDEEESDEVLTMMVDRHTDEDLVDLDDSLLEEDQLLKYITEAQSYHPEFTREMAEKHIETVKKLQRAKPEVDARGEEDEKDALQAKKRLLTKRKMDSLVVLAKAYAKLDFSQKVKERHYQEATDFFRRCFQSLGLQVGKDSFDDITTDTLNKRRTIKEVVDDLEEGSDAVEMEDLIQEAEERHSLEEEVVEEIVEDLLDSGQLFEPEAGKVSTL